MERITIMVRKQNLFLLWLLLALICGVARADDSLEEQKLAQCLNHAERLPDVTLAEAESWLKQGGGDRARLCRAFARFYRGDFNISAQEFAQLAAARDAKDAHHAASLHTQAGLAFMRAGNHRQSEVEYAAALKLEPQDPDVWVDRATERASAERYWDAIDDLNQALVIMPDMPEALRMRGQAWAQLGQTSKARSDLERAAIIDGSDVPLQAEVGKHSAAAKTLAAAHAPPDQ